MNRRNHTNYNLHIITPSIFTPMVFILDGCSFPVKHVWCKQGLFPKKKIGFDYSLDVTKCLQQIETSDLLHMWA